MYSTKDFLFDQSKFLSSRKLSFAGEAGKTRQVIYISFSPPDPVSRMNVPPTAGTAGAIPPEIIKFAEDIFIFDVTAGMPS